MIKFHAMIAPYPAAGIKLLNKRIEEYICIQISMIFKAEARLASLMSLYMFTYFLINNKWGITLFLHYYTHSFSSVIH